MNLEQQLIERLQHVKHLLILKLSMNLQVMVDTFQVKNPILKLMVVSEEFQGLRLVQRHQKIYAVADGTDESREIPRLSYTCLYPKSEWQGQAPASPECAHAPKN